MKMSVDIEDIPTECRRCHKVFDDKEMSWMLIRPGEMWWVCDHCADSIAWANKCIALLEAAKREKMIE